MSACFYISCYFFCGCRTSFLKWLHPCLNLLPVYNTLLDFCLDLLHFCMNLPAPLPHQNGPAGPAAAIAAWSSCCRMLLWASNAVHTLSSARVYRHVVTQFSVTQRRLSVTSPRRPVNIKRQRGPLMQRTSFTAGFGLSSRIVEH